MKKNYGKSTKDILLEHSKAKVELYAKYLSKYLNIIKRAGYYNKIHLYDLMCGEGIYADNSKGSPIIALETIRNHYNFNNNSCLDMDIWFNDLGKSDVEKGRNKIDRVKEKCKNIFKPPNINIKYSNQDFITEILPVIEKNIKNPKKEKFLLFLDPYGYKDITPQRLNRILTNNAVELLLFVPITPMYRFANKSLKEEDFKGGESLKAILITLLNGEEKIFKNENDFIETLKEKYRSYLKHSFFVDTFTIERNKSNTYALFFFTPHHKGFETMLKTKWELDEKRGRGFKIDTGQFELFENVEHFDYSDKLKSYIKNQNVTNKDLYIFGLNNGFLPTHSIEILRDWQNRNKRFKVLENGNPVRKGAFYISSDYYSGKKKKLVSFIFE